MTCRVSLSIAHSSIKICNLQLRNVNGVALPLSIQQENSVAYCEVPTQGMLFYEVKHVAHVPAKEDPIIYFAMAWLFIDGKRKMFFADIVYIERTMSTSANDIAALLAIEIHRCGIGHPYWQGYLTLSDNTSVGCALRVRCSNILPATIDISLSELSVVVSTLRSNLTWEPALWHTPATLPFGLLAGECAAKVLEKHLLDNLSAQIRPPTMVVLENLHSQVCLHQMTQHPQLLSDSMIFEEKPGATMIGLNQAKAFAAYYDTTLRTSIYYLIYTITRNISNDTNDDISSDMHSDTPYTYLVITWTTAGTSRQFYAVEILNTRLPLDPHTHEGISALSLITALSRLERGHCVQRDMTLALPTRTTVTMATYLSLAWLPTLLVVVASIEKSTELSRQNSQLSRRSTNVKRNVLPSIKISIENAHPSLELLDFQCLTTENDYIHNTDGLDNEIGVIASGGLHTFTFTPRSNRQIGILLFRVQAAQPIARSPLLVVAWRQNSETSNDLFFYSHIMEENTLGDRSNMLALDNLFTTVNDHRKSMFAKQSEGKLANGMEFTITTTLRRHTSRKELEATVCFTGNISGSENEDILSQVRQMAEEEAGEELVVAHQSNHPDLTLLNVQMYSFTGKVVERPKTTVGTDDTIMARMRYDKKAVDALEGSVKGFILAQIADKFGNPIPGHAHIIIAWRLKGPKRTFFVNALTFTKPPIPRLKDRQIQGRFFRQLIQRRLCLAGQDIIHHRLLLQSAPGIFLGATLTHRPLAQKGSSITLLHVALRKASNLPLHALSAAPTLAKQRRTIRNLRRNGRGVSQQVPTSPSVKIIDSESLHDMDQLWPQMEVAQPMNNRIYTTIEEDAASAERSIFVVNGSITMLNDDNSICVQLYANDEENMQPNTNALQAINHEHEHQHHSTNGNSFNNSTAIYNNSSNENTIKYMNAATRQVDNNIETLHNKSFNVDQSKMTTDNPLDEAGLIPNEPPMLDPLEFSSNRLEDALNMFCNLSNTTPTTIQTTTDNRGIISTDMSHSDTITPTTADSYPPDMLPYLLGGDVVPPSLRSTPSNTTVREEFNCRIVVINNMDDVAVRSVGHYVESGLQVYSPSMQPSTSRVNSSPTMNKSLEWTFVSTSNNGNNGNINSSYKVDATIACSIHANNENDSLLWAIRVMAIENVVYIGIVSKRTSQRTPLRLNTESLRQIQQVIICSPVLTGNIYRELKFSQHRILVIRGSLVNGLSTNVQLVLEEQTRQLVDV
ncbi:hypothetical protein BDF22DRAFT_673964 [Syncephalis plumigaleata]|nr:hypothetical protein BDF22DRAFT_673964 [Syncephalis plumigaleata]